MSTYRQILGGMGIMLFALGLIAARADAYPVTIYIEAEVDTVDDSDNYLEGKISPGDIITDNDSWHITDVYTDPVQPDYTDSIIIVVCGREGSGAVLINDSVFQIDATSLQLDIFLSTGFFAAVTLWSHSELIGQLPTGTYDLTVTAYYSGAFTGTDTYETSFTVIPEPTTVLLITLGLFIVRVNHNNAFRKV